MLSGCDVTSRIGTKKAALQAHIVKLKDFGKSPTLNDKMAKEAEHYLIGCLKKTS